MKSKNVLALAASLSLAATVTACASDQADIDDGTEDASTPVNPTRDSSVGGNPDHASSTPPPPPAVDANPPPSAEMCSSSCQTDSECQSWCPPPDAGGVYCCDLSNVCYPNASSSCPSTDGGGSNLPD